MPAGEVTVFAATHPVQGPSGLFRDMLCPQNLIFGTHKETCAKSGSSGTAASRSRAPAVES